MGLLRRLLLAVLTAPSPYRDPGPARLLRERRDAIAELQRAHVRALAVDPDLSDRDIYEHRVAWLTTKQRLLASGHDVAGLRLPDIEETRQELELLESHVEVERMLN